MVMADRIIAVDFDGTLCENAWPEIGEPIEPIVKYVKYQQFTGAKVMGWMKSTALNKGGAMFTADCSQSISEVS